MVKRRAFSSSDEYTIASSQRKNKILSPRTPKTMLKHQQYFDFSKITTTTTKTTTKTPKRRSASWSGVADEPSTTSITFRRVCRKYTISGEVAEQLAKIGDEIMRDYEAMLNEFNIVSLYHFFNAAMGMKRRRTVSPQQQHQHQRAENSRRRKISGYLGILLIHFIKNL